VAHFFAYRDGHTHDSTSSTRRDKEPRCNALIRGQVVRAPRHDHGSRSNCANFLTRNTRPCGRDEERPSMSGQLGDDRSKRIGGIGADDKVGEAALLPSSQDFLDGRRRVTWKYQ
jgi:hypothetical protein